MADPVKVYNPTTGRTEEYEPEQLARFKEQTGGRELTNDEIKAFESQREKERFHAADVPKFIGGMAAAHTVGAARGLGEAFGVPVDEAVLGLAEPFGKREAVRQGLRSLEEEHPIPSFIGGLGGQGAGLTLGGEAAEGAGALRGALENTVIGTTSDLNEAALGDHQLNSEKLVAGGLIHFGVGLGVDAGLSRVGKAIQAAAARAAPVAERAATRRVGAEFGGDEALGHAIREGLEGRIPSSAREVAEAFGKKQAEFRTAAKAEREAAVQAGADTRQAAVDWTKERHAENDLEAYFSRKFGEKHAAEQAELAGHKADAQALAEEIGGNRAANQAQLDTLADRLDKVEGAELPQVSRIIPPEVSGPVTIDPDAGLRASAPSSLHRPISTFGRGALTEAELPRVIESAGGDMAAVRKAYNASGVSDAELDAMLAKSTAEGRVARGLSTEDLRIDHEGMRPESLEAVRAARARGEDLGPIQVWEYPGERPFLGDGRHRLAVAKELGDRSIRAERLRYDAEGNVIGRETSDLPLKGGLRPGPLHPANDTTAVQEGGLYPSVYRNAKTDVAQPALRVAAPELTPAENLAGENAMKAVTQWSERLKASYPDGRIPFRDMATVQESLESLAKTARDPIAKKAFNDLRKIASEEFDRASEATAAGVGEGASLHSERLRGLAKDLEAAHEHALGEVEGFTKKESDLAKAQLAERQEAARLIAAQRAQNAAELKAIPAPEKVPAASKATPFDDIAARARATIGSEEPRHAVSSRAAIGSLFAMLHGNLLAALGILGGSFVAGRARATGNLGAARMLQAVADHLHGFDAMMRSEAGRAVRRTAGVYARRAGALVAEQAIAPEKPQERSYKRTVEYVRAVQENPALLEARINRQIGPLATAAPQHYAAVLETAQRAQKFLELAIPPSRRDPYDPTAHLKPDDVSPAEQYDFLEYAAAIRDPMSVLRAVGDGTVTQQQVAVLKEVYPGLYAQAKGEVSMAIADLSKPLEYERAIHLGTLFEEPTNSALDPGWQQAQAQLYAARAKQEKITPPGSAPKGPNARMSKANMSGSQQVESGEGY